MAQRAAACRRRASAGRRQAEQRLGLGYRGHRPVQVAGQRRGPFHQRPVARGQLALAQVQGVLQAWACPPRAGASPGIAERFEPDNPGMHTTDSVDYIVVLAGEVWLELDDGRLTRLRAGDTVVQNGTRHAWRNRGTEPVTLAVVQLGVQR